MVPRWPEEFGKLDSGKVAAGKVLYAKNCLSCHEIVEHGFQNTPVQVVMTPVAEVGTDPRMALNSAVGEVETGDLKLLFLGQGSRPSGGNAAAISSVGID